MLLLRAFEMSQASYLREQDSRLAADLTRLLRKVIVQKRIAVQLLETTAKSNKAGLLKRLMILLKNIKGTFPKFNSEVLNATKEAQNLSENDASQKSPDSRAKVLCVVPGFHNIAYESFDVTAATKDEQAHLMVASELTS